MKRKMSLFLAMLMAAGTLAACGSQSAPETAENAAVTESAADETSETADSAETSETAEPADEADASADAGVTVSVTVAEETDTAAFAKSEIETALTENDMTVSDADAEWTITLAGVDDTLPAEGYRIEVADQTITVTGGDDNGLMYGGLEVAEQIALADSVKGVENTEDAPDIPKRGIRFNLPVDMRTPDYSAPGDSYQANIETVWDISFWHEYLDELARNRYNVITLWTVNPLPHMVKVADYPDIALDDVYRTTLPFDDTYSGTGNDNFRKEHLDNYEVVKKITIDEKIEFWKEVMAYAKSRGFEFDIYMMNLYVFGEMGMFGEPGKYGITPDINNDVTKDYLRKSVAALIETYPDLDGIGMSAGENMPTIPEEDPLQNDRFIWETYGQGANDALANDPDRDFTIVYSRVDIGDYWSQLAPNITLAQRAGYASQHMNSDADLMTVRLGGHQSAAAKQMSSAEGSTDMKTSILDEIPEGAPIYVDIRNEDAYLLRLGDVEFLRDILVGFPRRDPYVCYTLGFAGYCQGREYGYIDEERNGGLYIDKNWYVYRMFGRLGYDNELSNERISAIFQKHFEEIEPDRAEQLRQALGKASGLVREVNKVHHIISSDSAFYPELMISHSNTFGYLNVKRFMKSKSAEEGSGYMSIAEYIAAYAEAGGEPETDLVTPLEVCEYLTRTGAEIRAEAEALNADRPSSYATDAEWEFYDTLDDVLAWSYWADYVAAKFQGAVSLGIYDKTGDASFQEAAVKNLENALTAWNAFAENYGSRYKAQRLARHGYWDVYELAENVEKDIRMAETWLRRDAEGGAAAAATDRKVSEADPAEGNPYAGVYDLTATVGERQIVFDTFEIDKEGKVTGLIEDSGMTGFTGTIDENGHFDCDMIRMKGGKVTGDIDDGYHVTGNLAARGMEGTLDGNLLY